MCTESEYVKVNSEIWIKFGKYSTNWKKIWDIRQKIC